MPQPRVALITCANRVEPDPDETLLLDAIAATGVHAEWIAWDGEVKPEGFDLTCLRTCWNYYRDIAGFRDWIDATAGVSALWNPREVLHWNLHKRYLEEIERAGIATIPTRWIGQGEEPKADALYAGDIVVKPCISASSFGTRRFSGEESDDALDFATEFARGRDVMVQPVMTGFQEPGERSLVWIDGAFTHAVTKRPRYAGEDEAISQASALSLEERAFGERVLEIAPAELLYARVDMIIEQGEPMLSELELVEPSLFLREHPAALERFAEAIGRRARR